MGVTLILYRPPPAFDGYGFKIRLSLSLFFQLSAIYSTRFGMLVELILVELC